MKFLIVKTSALGDLIQTFDALAYLRDKMPFAQIEWVVEKEGAELIEAHPFVDKVHVIDTRTWRRHPFKRGWRTIFAAMPSYHVVFDLQGNCKSAWILAHVKAALKIGFGKKTVAEWPNRFFTQVHVDPPPGQNIREDYLALIQHHFQDKTLFEAPPVTLRIPKKEQVWIEQMPAEAILVCPFAAWPNKRLPAETLLSVLDQEEGPFYFAWGNQEERVLADQFTLQLPQAYLLPKVSLPVLQQLMARSRKVIAMDSLPLHLCGTTPTPSVSFFGPSRSQKYAPKGSRHTVIQGRCPFNVQFEKRCPFLRTCQSGDCINKLKLR